MQQWESLDLRHFRWSRFANGSKLRSVSAQNPAQLDSVNSIEYPVKAPKKPDSARFLRNAMRSTRVESVHHTDESECDLHLYLLR